MLPGIASLQDMADEGAGEGRGGGEKAFILKNRIL